MPHLRVIRQSIINPGDLVATREAYGTALARIGETDQRIVALDGDTKNSTYADKFFKKFPDRLHPNVSLPSKTCRRGHRVRRAPARCRSHPRLRVFFTRAYDQIRVAGISQANLKLVGSHVGVSIGEDGPSQMALEDIAMMRAVAGSGGAVSTCDAASTEKLVEQMAQTKGICFLRTSRPKTP